MNTLRTFLRLMAYNLPVIRHIYRTRYTAGPITVLGWIIQKILGKNRSAYWPVHFTSRVSNPDRIRIGKGTAPGASPGCYIQGYGGIFIGDYTLVGPNVGLISANHDFYDYRVHRAAQIRIGDYCWIGMNATVLPGVELGDHTIVAANAVVTRSFPGGYVVLGGIPAVPILTLERDLCISYQNKYEYYGYIPAELFEVFWKHYGHI